MESSKKKKKQTRRNQSEDGIGDESISVRDKKPQLNNRNVDLHYTLTCPNNNMEADERSSDSDSDDDGGVKGVRIVPGEDSYREVVKKNLNSSDNTTGRSSASVYRREKTLIFTTSISKGILPWKFNKVYEEGWASFTRFPGAKAEYMETYISPRMENERPSVVILQAGGNDLQINSRGKTSQLVTVANSIINAGLACKNKFGVQHILIGGVTTTIMDKMFGTSNKVPRSPIQCWFSNFPLR